MVEEESLNWQSLEFWQELLRMDQWQGWLQSTLDSIRVFLAEAGIPDVWLDISALGVLYLGTILVILLFVFLLFRMLGRGRRRESRIPVSPPVPKPETVEETASTVDVSSVDSEQDTLLQSPSLMDRMRHGLAKTRSSFIGRLDTLFSGNPRLDDDLLEELEDILIAADFGMQTTQALVDSLAGRVDSVTDIVAVKQALKEDICKQLHVADSELPVTGHTPFVIMVVGVNGVGKTTTIGKLAKKFTQEGKKVVLGAGDTFRAAAAEQLAVWGERSGVDVICHAEGSDPAAVAFDAAKAAVARKADILLLDTAGRLHNKSNLMEELKKIRRVMEREIPHAPHETLLVLDATTGQNALIQAKQFKETVAISGIALTKLDGTAKGGVVVAIASELNVPVRYVGVGEGVDDLRPFDAHEFVEALFTEPETT